MAVKPTSTIGRRKTATARVYIKKGGSGQILVNNREVNDYFPRATTQMIIRQPLVLTERLNSYDFRISVRGGGNSGQAGAVLLGIARALLRLEPDLRPVLKQGGFMTRDARKVERKKPGRHKARKRPQFSKR